MSNKKVKKAILKVMLHSFKTNLIKIVNAAEKDITKKVLKKEIDILWEGDELNSAEIVQYLKVRFIDSDIIGDGIDGDLVRSIIKQRDIASS